MLDKQELPAYPPPVINVRAPGHKAASKLRATLAACALALSAGACLSAPDSPPSDAIMRLLEDRGMLNAQGKPIVESELLTQVRDKASDLVLTAMNFIGVRYQRGGNSADQGFDCSGFTRYVFEHSVGFVLPRRAAEQATLPGLLSIPKDELKPGDLVFFNTLRKTFSHVGIYIGDGKFIHSPRSGQSVRVEDMRIDYWTQRFNGARRAPQTADALNRANP